MALRGPPQARYPPSVNDRAVLLAAPPSDAGTAALLARSLARAPADVLLSGDGLAWSEDPGLAEAAHGGRARAALCTVTARGLGWTPQTAPDWIAWSSVATWLSRHVTADERVVAIFAAGETGAAAPQAAEFFRVLVGYVAAGAGEVRLLTLGPGSDVLAGDVLPVEAERYLDALREVGVEPESASGEILRTALANADCVSFFGARERPSEPALLVVDDEVLGLAVHELETRVQAAGLIVRA